MPDPYAASRAAGDRIATLYGRPVTELAVGAEPGTMRYALLNAFDALQHADRGVAFYAEQLHRLTAPGSTFEAADAGHIIDAARRLAHAVTARDAHDQVLGDVLQSLHRVPEPAPVTPPAVPETAVDLPPAVVSPAARAR
ncbi:hypothetical protein ACFUIZ_27515 [Streptomyces cinereoruber]|uniref:hypothetical protein n=1 Tax=Streptomyces cinereoruber TaxID=67260 RepID=UPI00363AD75B